jgi:probable DNA metabolism protein
VKPEAVVWTVERELFSDLPQTTPFIPFMSKGQSAALGEALVREHLRSSRQAALTVPAAFVDLAKDRHPAPLARALGPALPHPPSPGGQPRLLDNPADADVAKARDMAKGVGRAIHKMHAFVRFRLVEEVAPEGTYVAWFEPAHRVTEAAAPFFARRFANMNWSILTPDACVHWDGPS